LNLKGILKNSGDAGSYQLTVHQGRPAFISTVPVHEIKRLGMKAGVALNPHTPVSTLEDIIAGPRRPVLIMTVNPGFGGQQFISQSYARIRKTQKLVDVIGFPRR